MDEHYVEMKKPSMTGFLEESDAVLGD